MNTEDLSLYDNRSYMNFTSKMNFDRDLTILIGIITGIDCDQVINKKEIEGLREWISSVEKKSNREPYRSIVAYLNEALSDNILTPEERQDIIWLTEQYLENNGFYIGATTGIQQLIGIVNGITMDNYISQEELEFLDNWMEENRHLRNCWPYDELYSMTTRILKDRIITPQEHNELMDFCKCFASDKSLNKGLQKLLQEGQCQVDPEIIIPENLFCITGISRKYKRKEIGERIELYGGIMKNNVTMELNYLVVCDEKNSCWAYSCYGRKVEEVITHRRNGFPIAIIHEFDLYDTIESMS